MAGDLLNPGWSRRGFMQAVLSACAAPAIVRAQNVMPIWVPSSDIALPMEQQIEVAGAEWLELPEPEVRMAGGSRGDIGRGLCVPYTRDGVTVMGYRFPQGFVFPPTPERGLWLMPAGSDTSVVPPPPHGRIFA